MTLAQRHRKPRGAILRWYARHKRDLPWRRVRDPYAILVSEVMLQQTQVERVVPKYEAFLAAFPTPAALAAASQADVLRRWSGLGYNRRALHLQAAAAAVARDGWPTTVEGMRRLPGVGEYTAGAVLSFAFGKRTLAFDVNVQRVLRRAFIGVKSTTGNRQEWNRRSIGRLKTLAEALLPRDAATWQQALMDLGATVCRATPRCATCPLRRSCPSAAAFLAGWKEPRAAKPQGRFADSNRFVRGAIVRELGRGRMTLARLRDTLAPAEVTADRIRTALVSLLADGLIRRQGRVYALPER